MNRDTSKGEICRRLQKLSRPSEDVAEVMVESSDRKSLPYPTEVSDTLETNWSRLFCAGPRVRSRTLPGLSTQNFTALRTRLEQATAVNRIRDLFVRANILLIVSSPSFGHFASLMRGLVLAVRLAEFSLA